jgi:hypothetical protein
MRRRLIRNGSTAAPAPKSDAVYCFPLASLKAFLTVGRALPFSQDLWDTYEADLMPKLNAMYIPSDVYGAFHPSKRPIRKPR